MHPNGPTATTVIGTSTSATASSVVTVDERGDYNTFCCCTVSMSSVRFKPAAALVIPRLSLPHEVRLAFLKSFGLTVVRAAHGALVTPPPPPASGECVAATILPI